MPKTLKRYASWRFRSKFGTDLEISLLVKFLRNCLQIAFCIEKGGVNGLA
jgi:hypothetical protein